MLVVNNNNINQNLSTLKHCKNKGDWWHPPELPSSALLRKESHGGH